MPILTRGVGGVDEKTYKFWVFLFIEALAGMKQRVVSGNLILISSRLLLCSHMSSSFYFIRLFGATDFGNGMVSQFV
jgi:hypothetical protein